MRTSGKNSYTYHFNLVVIQEFKNFCFYDTLGFLPKVKEKTFKIKIKIILNQLSNPDF